MRFTVIGHSCLYIETDAGTILVDPWLFGSAFWRSWWHYPPSASPTPEQLAPDYLYLTHHHFDHFHYPSMRKLDKRTKVLVPRFGVDVMPAEVRSLGFTNIEELPHGDMVELGAGVAVGSFQYGFDDTAFAVRDRTSAIVDFNDCKIRGKALDHLRQQVGHVSVMLKSHSYAQTYPVSYTAEDPADLERITDETYLADFSAVAAQLRPDAAVPFGSMVGFFHPDGHHINERLVTPSMVADRFTEFGGPADCEVAEMVPGDTWSVDEGFHLAENDWYTNRDAHIEAMIAEAKPKVDAQIAHEAQITMDWDVFRTHFEEFLNALPPVVNKLVAHRPITFVVPSGAPEQYWSIDIAKRSVTRATTPPADHASLFHLSEGVLAEAIERRISHFMQGIMRSNTELKRGGLASDLTFWGLLMVWEIGYLPIQKNINRRVIDTARRRRREFIDFAPLLQGQKGFDKLSNNFAPEAELQ